MGRAQLWIGETKRRAPCPGGDSCDRVPGSLCRGRPQILRTPRLAHKPIGLGQAGFEFVASRKFPTPFERRWPRPRLGRPGALPTASDSSGGYTVFEALEKQPKLEKRRTKPGIVLQGAETNQLRPTAGTGSSPHLRDRLGRCNARRADTRTAGGCGRERRARSP